MSGDKDETARAGAGAGRTECSDPAPQRVRRAVRGASLGRAPPSPHPTGTQVVFAHQGLSKGERREDSKQLHRVHRVVQSNAMQLAFDAI